MGESKRRKQIDPNYGKSFPHKQTKLIKLTQEPDYSVLVDVYLSEGVAGLVPFIIDWLEKTGQIYSGESASELQNKINQVSMTVYSIASKQIQNLASSNIQVASFTLNVPFELQDYGNYKPVQDNLELAREAMSLINMGFFDGAITYLINKEGDAISTLRRCGVVLYMGTNYDLEIIDAACALATWQPFEVSVYIGEQRNSLTNRIEKTFSPLIDRIRKFRIEQKGADKFPCLTLLCLIENRANGEVCEFRRHYTAQGGGQLIIPGFSDHVGSQVLTKMNVLGKPRNIPKIRGLA